MDRKNRLTDLFRGVATGAISRREFVGRALALGVGMSTIGTVLTACSKSGEPAGKHQTEAAGDQPATGAAAQAQQPAQPAKEELEKELRIYNWSDYIAEDTIPNFEKEFGVKVIYDTFESSEEIVAKMQIGASGYDLVVPSSHSVPALLAQGLLDKLDKSKIPNYKNISPLFTGQYYDPQSEHTVPWQWGITGIAYRKDKVKGPIDSWGVFHDPQYKNKMTQMDEMRDVLGAWLKYRGKSANATSAEELSQAKQDAIAAKKLLRSYISASVKGQLVAGDIWIAQLWNGDTAQAKVEQANIEFVTPKEGAIMWVDTMAIPKNAPHKRAAHAFLNYVLRPEVGAAISDFTGYGSPNQEALAKMATPVSFPTEQERKSLELQKDLGADAALWDTIWTEIKAS